MTTKKESDKAVTELTKLALDKEYKLADYPNAALSRVRLDLAANYNIAVTMPKAGMEGTFTLSKIS